MLKIILQKQYTIEFIASTQYYYIRTAICLNSIASLNAPLSDDDDSLSLIDTLIDDRCIDGQLSLERNEIKSMIHEALNRLSVQERQIVVYRYLDGKTLEATGTRYNIPVEQVRQIEGKAMRKLRADRFLRAEAMGIFNPDQ